MKKFQRMTVLALALVVVFALTGCQTTDTSDATTTAPAKTTAAQTTAATTAAEKTTAEAKQDDNLSGEVVIAGSGTVYPLMQYIVEEYAAVQPDVSVSLANTGSSAGFKKWVVGETDLNDASRAIKDKEKAAFVEGGYSEDDILEIKIALDGLTMVINKDNDWATEMTRDEVVNMYISGKFNAEDKVMWSDIRPEWPKEEIKFYGPNESHGTYEFFYEKILDEQEMVKTATLEQEYATLVDLVSKEKNAIAYFGYGYYASNQDKLQAVKIDFGDGPVEPTLDTIGEELPYAGFTRPVFTYVNLAKAKENPAVLDFSKYVVSSEGAERLAGETGFAPLPVDVYEGYMTALDALK